MRAESQSPQSDVPRSLERALNNNVGPTRRSVLRNDNDPRHCRAESSPQMSRGSGLGGGDVGHWRGHLDWSAKQGRLLTDGGNALKHYSPENGFPFSPQELPHHFLERGATHATFMKWAKDDGTGSAGGDRPQLEMPQGVDATLLRKSPIVGVWDRPLFTGKWEHSTNRDEIVCNVQTGTLFVDLRIPRSKPVERWEKLTPHPRQALESMSDHEIRLFARQHVFGGYSMLTCESRTDRRPICTRHHCIDWNHVPGKPRPRPNKWYIDCNTTCTQPANVWKESSYSTDEHGQSYYFERWERINGDGNGEGLRLAMRKKSGGPEDGGDGILVVVGDHFNYILSRELSGRETAYPDAKSSTELVDAAIENGDRETAISHLTLDGGHGTISSGWKIDCSIQPWNHGMSVFDRLGGKLKVLGNGTDFFQWTVFIGDTAWEIYECSVPTAGELQKLLVGQDNSQSRL